MTVSVLASVFFIFSYFVFNDCNKKRAPTTPRIAGVCRNPLPSDPTIFFAGKILPLQWSAGLLTPGSTVLTAAFPRAFRLSVTSPCLKQRTSPVTALGAPRNYTVFLFTNQRHTYENAGSMSRKNGTTGSERLRHPTYHFYDFPLCDCRNALGLFP